VDGREGTNVGLDSCVDAGCGVGLAGHNIGPIKCTLDVILCLQIYGVEEIGMLSEFTASPVLLPLMLPKNTIVTIV